MKKEIVISGFGGQGGLAIGKNLAEAGMAEGSPTSPWDLPCSPIPPSSSP